MTKKIKSFKQQALQGWIDSFNKMGPRVNYSIVKLAERHGIDGASELNKMTAAQLQVVLALVCSAYSKGHVDCAEFKKYLDAIDAKEKARTA